MRPPSRLLYCSFCPRQLQPPSAAIGKTQPHNAALEADEPFEDRSGDYAQP